jgi:diguanylate cyclase (GGDEF)-like protein/PAS domain S-box-containing protein
MTAPDRIRVLLAEDVPSDAELEVRELKRAGLRVEYRIVGDEDGFRRELRDFFPDVVLSDFSMPQFDGMAALSLARDEAPDVPFIFVSGTIGEEYAIRALKNGATDYVIKNNLVRLPAAVERAVAEAKARRERRRTEAELDIARERLTSIFTSLPDLLWSLDAASGEHIYVSPAAREIYGRSPDEFLANRNLWLELIHPDDLPAVRSAWEKVPHGGNFEFEYRIRHTNGSTRWINNRGRLVKGAAGAPDRIDGMVRDITERIEQTRKLARLQRIRDVVGALNAAIVRIHERQELFGEFCRIAVSQGRYVLARIIEIDRDGKARVASTTEADPRLFQAVVDDYNRDPEGADSLIARVLRDGQAIISNSVANDERAGKRSELTRDGDYSLALLPIVADERLAGVMTLRAREPGSFDAEELRLLYELVSNISFALESMAKQEKLEYLALYDQLTGLPNRTFFTDRLTRAIEAARRNGGRLALMVFDLERFKAINDTFGRRAGDKVLRKVARRMRQAVSDESCIARLGGDQFAILLPAIQDATDVVRMLGDAAPHFLDAPVVAGGRDLRLAAKAGIALFPEDGGDADALFRNAEATLKKAKETGERYLFYAPQINARVADQVELEHRLRLAVERGEMFLHYQPKVEFSTRRIVGLEALLRWKGPDGSHMSPARFVPVLEQTGLILEVGRQALAAAGKTYREWQARGLNPPRIAVNVSAIQLRRPGFVEDVLGAIGDPRSDGGGVDIEVTESLLMSDIDESIRKLRTLRDHGLHIALDDFGTGFSSLSYLSKLPLDSLKIDRSFIHGMTERADDTSIVSTIIALAQGLRLKVVAEGVETEQQAHLLKLLRCDQMQGYLFSPPVPAERIEALLKAI